jgi:hypothetical protein
VELPIRGRIAYLEIRRAEWARGLLRAPLRWSAVAGGIWLVRDQRLVAAIEDARRLLRELTSAPRDEPWLGPRLDFASEEALYEELVSIWSRSSLQLSRVCRANGITYLHFLEPNPIASPPVGAMRGYPRLASECAQLAAGGVPCRDLASNGRGNQSAESIVAESLIAELTSTRAFDSEIRH